MKKRRRHVLLVLGMMLFLFGYAGASGKPRETAVDATVPAEDDPADNEPVEDGGPADREEAAAGQESGQQTESREPEDEQNDVLNRAIDTVLKAESCEFLGGYPMDESFLFWFRSAYGGEALNRVSAEAAAGMDPDIWFEVSGNSIHVLWLDYCEAFNMHTEKLERVTRQECASDDQIVLGFAGDMNFDDRTRTMKFLKSSGIRAVFSEGVRGVMDDTDILMVNNECTFSTRGEPLAGKSFTFRSDPSNVSILQELGVDIVGIANNHVCDYGLDALTDTIATLDEAGMPNVGAGNNLEEAKRPWYFVANGRKIAFVAATQIERSYNYTKEATDTTPGVLKTLNPDKFLEVIEHTSRHSDYVMVYVHWGTEGAKYYGKDQEKLAKQFAEAGADAIIGGHTHCLQGITYIGDVPVIYSLGNFWFGSTPSDGVKKRDSCIAQVIIDADGGMQFRFIPCIQEQLQTYLVTEESEKTRIITYEQYLSDGVTIDEDGYVTKTN